MFEKLQFVHLSTVTRSVIGVIAINCLERLVSRLLYVKWTLSYAFSLVTCSHLHIENHKSWYAVKVCF